MKMDLPLILSAAALVLSAFHCVWRKDQDEWSVAAYFEEQER